MASTALVERDLEVGRRIMGALTHAGIPVKVAFWAHIPEIDEWQFFIATPLVDSKGPRSAYEQVLQALRNEDIDSDLPWRRIFLRSPKDPVLKALGEQSRSLPHENFQAVNATIGDKFVQDAYLYAGSIYIVKVSMSPSGRDYYSIVYAPHKGPRLAAPPGPPLGIDDLKDFLVNKVHLSKETIDARLSDLNHRGSVSIPIELTATELRKLGLT